MEPSGPELLPASAERVAKSSRTAANRRIRENMTAELRRCAAMGVGEIHEQIKRLRR